MQPVLSIKGLTVRFSSKEDSVSAVDNLHLEIKPGELHALVGESGSGKSITALSILKLLPNVGISLEGGICFTGNDRVIEILTADEEVLRSLRGNRIAMVFQEPMTSLNPLMNCGEQVAENLRNHYQTSKADAKEKVLSLFEKVKLPAPEVVYGKYPHQLSGGQKQRVMIAIAMVCNPTLLICDEPTTALDVTVQKSILELIRQLQLENNMAVLFISHDLGVVADIADSITVMYKGKAVEQGPASTVLTEPSHPYTKALLACRPSMHNKGERLPVVADFLKEESCVTKQEPQLFVPNSNDHKILEVKNLRVSYPVGNSLFGKTGKWYHAVQDVSFYVKEGETLGLVGESGCGKTTLGRCVLGLIKPSAGEVLYKQHNIHTHSAERFRMLRKEMQLIFQDPYSSLDPRQPIGKAIEEPLIVHNIYPGAGVRKDKVVELLEKVNLPADYYHRYPHQLSGGQRQRIVIARALALEPSFIVCDESVSALDVSVQAQVLNLLNELKTEFGFTAIFISHDLAVVRYLSDRIMVMKAGRIEEEGAAEQVYNHPASLYTRQLLAAIPGRTINSPRK